MRNQGAPQKDEINDAQPNRRAASERDAREPIPTRHFYGSPLTLNPTRWIRRNFRQVIPSPADTRRIFRSSALRDAEAERAMSSISLAVQLTLSTAPMEW